MKKLLISVLTFLCTTTIYANTIKLVVPVSSGATMDSVARVIAPELGRNLNKVVVVENIPGAGGALAMRHIVNSDSDGLTLVLVNNGTLNMSPILNIDAGFSSSSFTSIGLVGTSPLVLVVNTKIPVNNLKELTEYIANNPNTTSWASPGQGTNLHLLGEVLKSKKNLNMVHISYKGMAPAMTDLIGGRVTMLFDVYNPVMAGFIDANKIRPIAVTGNSRITTIPNIATVSEQGFSFLEAYAWIGISISADTQPNITTQLKAALTNALEEEQTKIKLRAVGLGPTNIKANNAQKFMDSEKTKWTSIVKNTNLKVE
jgi:tripartite-type tricarboxylate transporter receptor subunit TctC